MSNYYLDVEALTECDPTIEFYGWSVEHKKISSSATGYSLYRIVQKIVTNIKYYEIAGIDQLNGDYEHVEKATGSFNGGAIIDIPSSGTGFSSTYSDWYTDGEEITFIAPRGGELANYRVEYVSYGPWQNLSTETPEDWSQTHCINPTAENINGVWYDSIGYKTSSKQTTIPSGSTDIQLNDNRQKILQVQFSLLVDNISAILPATSIMPYYDDIGAIYNWTDNKGEGIITTDKTLPIVDKDFRLVSESFTPYDKDGSKMMLWTSVAESFGNVKNYIIY